MAVTVPRANFVAESKVKVRKADFPKPTIEMAKAMPREYYEYPNSILVPLALNGDYGARRERLIREVRAQVLACDR